MQNKIRKKWLNFLNGYKLIQRSKLIDHYYKFLNIKNKIVMQRNHNGLKLGKHRRFPTQCYKRIISTLQLLSPSLYLIKNQCIRHLQSNKEDYQQVTTITKWLKKYLKPHYSDVKQFCDLILFNFNVAK